MDAGLYRLLPEMEVELTCLGAQGVKRLFQRRAPRPPRKCNRCQAMVRQHDQLSSLVATDMLSRQTPLVQNPNFVTIGANADGPACQGWWYRVTIAVELDPGMRSNHRRHDLISVVGNPRQCVQHRPLLLKAVYRPFSGCFVYPHIGDLVAPHRCKCQVVLKADELIGASGQGIVLQVAHRSLDDSFVLGRQLHLISANRVKPSGSLIRFILCSATSSHW